MGRCGSGSAVWQLYKNTELSNSFYLALNITMSSKVSSTGSYMLCFVSLLHCHFIKWFQREYNLQTVNPENELWFAEWGPWPQLCLFWWGRERSENSASVLPLAKGQSISANLQWGNKHIMLRTLPACVKCCGYWGIIDVLLMFTGLQSSGNTLQRADRIRTEMICWKETNCRHEDKLAGSTPAR